METEDEVLRCRYVEELVRQGSITTDEVRQAFLRVRRHRFLRFWYEISLSPEKRTTRISWTKLDYDPDNPTPQKLAEVYSDRAIVTRVDGVSPTSSTSEPSLVAEMLEFLRLRPGMRVLEIGTGTGYNAALLAELVGDSALVYTVEAQPDVAEEARAALQREGYGGVRVFVRDGFYGAPEGAPFDRVVATVGCPDLSPHWLAQLSEGGFMLVPLQHGHYHPLGKIARDPEHPGYAQGKLVGQSSFMPMKGMLSWANPWQSFLIKGLDGEPAWSRPLPDPLPRVKDNTHPLRDPVHRSFHFFLTLSTRELWTTNLGYGLADPGARAAVLITGQEVVGHHPGGGAAAAARLYGRLFENLERWEKLGRPAPGSYELRFMPKGEFPHLEGDSEEAWMIERVFFWQQVRLLAQAS